MVEHHPSSPKDQSRIHQFGKKVFPGSFLDDDDRGVNLERRFLESRLEKFGNVGYIRYVLSENQSKGSVDQSEKWWIHLADRRWYSKIVTKRPRIPRTHSKAGTDRKERRFQWRVSTRRPNRRRWSKQRLLVDSRWLHLSSSHWTSSSTLCAEGKTFLIPMKYIVVSRSTHTETCRSCGKHGSVLSVGFIPRLRLCWRLWTLEINLRWSLVYFRKPNICLHQLDVQETNVSIPQFYRIWNHFFGCWIAHGWITCSRPLDVVIEVLHSTNNTARHAKLAQGDLCGTGDHSSNKTKTKTPTEKSKRGVDQLSNVDYVPTNAHSSQGESQLYILEDSEAVIKMIIKGWSPTMRQTRVQNPHGYAWLFDRINLEPKIQIKYVDTRNQLAVILTKGSLSRDDWNHHLRLFSIMNFSMYSCSHFSNFLSDPIGKQSAMSKRGQELTSSEGSPMAKPEPMVPAKARPVNLVLRSPWSARENPPQDLGYPINPVIILVQRDLYGPPKTQKLNVLKWGDRKMLEVQIVGNSAIRRKL